MRVVTKAKRSLHIVVLSASALAVIAGGYLVFRYSSLIPPLYHKDKVKTLQAPAAIVPGDASQPLAPQPAQPDNAVGVSSSRMMPSTSSPIPSATSSIPSNLTTPEQLQAAPTVAGALQSLANQAQTTTKDLLKPLTRL